MSKRKCALSPNASQKRWREEALRLFYYEPLSGNLVRLCQSGRGRKGQTAGSNDRRYLKVGILGSQVFAHRLIWLMVHGEWPDQIDHINHVRDDNRIKNLRSVSHHENHKNKKRSKANTSGRTGVWWNKINQNWCADIKVCMKKIYLGSYADFDDAVVAREDAEIKYGFHYNHGLKI